MKANKSNKSSAAREAGHPGVDSLCQNVMVAVATAIKRSQKSVRDYDQACKVMRAEINAFLLGDAYKNEREGIMNGSIGDGYVMQRIIAECISKIEYKEVK